MSRPRFGRLPRSPASATNQAQSPARSTADAHSLIGELGPAGGAAALNELLALPERPTAVVVASQPQAIGVLEAARSRGVCPRISLSWATTTASSPGTLA